MIPQEIQSCERGGEQFLFDPLRQMWVVATPEEWVRQNLLLYMVHECGYPPSLLVIECALNQLPHIAHQENLPTRRIDLLCYTKREEQLSPLVMIECKAVPLGRDEKEQLIGYNHFINAPCIVLVNQETSLTAFPGIESVSDPFSPGFPHYKDLLG